MGGSIEKRGESEGGRERGVGRYMAVRRRRRRKEGWRTTRKSREERTPSEGEAKEESRRRGGRGRASMWLKRSEEDGWRGGLASEGQKKKKKEKKRGERRERERKEHMDTGSLALSIHMPSHQMVVCVHTPEMSQPNAPFKSLLPTISSCSHVG